MALHPYFRWFLIEQKVFMSNILYEHHGRVRLITINRANLMNSLDFEANDELIEVWREFDQDALVVSDAIFGVCVWSTSLPKK